MNMSNNTELKQTTKIEDSPFSATWFDEYDSWMLTLGNEIMTNPKDDAYVFQELDELKAWVDTKPWELIMKAAAVFTNNFNEVNKK
jgi:hypothetical protein